MNFAFGTGGSTHRFLFRVLFGVVRGCPLSCLLFAVLLDPFLRAISALIDDKGDAVTRACADDIGAAVRGIQALKKFSSLFKAMRWASGLQLGFAKCCVVPFARRFSLVASLFKGWLDTNIGDWRTFQILVSGKYLGFMLGPGAGSTSWHPPLAKYFDRVRLIAGVGAAPSVGTLLYNSCALPVLGYVSQLFPRPIT